MSHDVCIFGEGFKVAKLAGYVICLLSGVIRTENEFVGARPEIVDVVPSPRLTDTDERPVHIRDHVATTTQVRDHFATAMFSIKFIMF